MNPRRPCGPNAPPVPDAALLRDAALAHLARYATTEAGLRRVLARRIDRWARTAALTGDPDAVARQAHAARQAARQVVAELAAAGAVSDAAFAEARVRGLTRAGRSRRAIAAHLAAKGVDAATARAALPDDEETEFSAALAFARRRRIGPFRAGGEPDDATRRRELAMLARAGFSHTVAERALDADAETAEARVVELRRG